MIFGISVTGVIENLDLTSGTTTGAGSATLETENLDLPGLGIGLMIGLGVGLGAGDLSLPQVRDFFGAVCGILISHVSEIFLELSPMLGGNLVA